MTDRSEDITALRRQVDLLDEDLVALLKRRVELARRIGVAKGGTPVVDPVREGVVVRHIHHLWGEEEAWAAESVWREILALCRRVQRPDRVACLGPEGSFSAEAARKTLGDGVTVLFSREFSELFRSVEEGRADLAVVPIENSREGGVAAALDAVVAGSPEIRVQREIFLPVRYVLASREDSLRTVREVRSHPQGLAQCREWLQTRLPGIPCVVEGSTSAAAEAIARFPGGAAICSGRAAEAYGLPVLATDVQDCRDNVTRFWIFGRGTPGPTGWDKTSFFFRVSSDAEALLRVLEPLARERCPLAHLHAQPCADTPFGIRFFADVVGHEEGENVARALRAVGQCCPELRVFGSYPAQP